MARHDKQRSHRPRIEALESRDLLSVTPVVASPAQSAAPGSGQASVAVATQGSPVLPPPAVPLHSGSIGIVELAYDGMPLDSAATQLLHQNVDLTVSGQSTLGPISAIAPATPQLVYTNVSNLYHNLLTDWLTYADSHGMYREDPFYHVARATAFSGNSPSSQPVDWFWGVYRGGGATWTNLTSQANGSARGGVSFASLGNEVVVGYPERFREINLTLASGAGQGWSAQLEYPTAVDASGKPIAWATLTPLTNSTANLTKSGQITFDPPANWKSASLDGSARLYYVRFRTIKTGTAPVARTILGRDYVHAAGRTSGIIPAFDYSADKDHDGYLNDAEYANRKPGLDARFAYESRLFYPTYGQMRFATNPANTSFAKWAANYESRYMASHPLAAGLFVDNSTGNAPAATGNVVESVAGFSSHYAALLTDIGHAIGPHWIMANTGGSSAAADPIVEAVQATFDEAALKPLASTYIQFEQTAAVVANWNTLSSASRYLVLDSASTGGSPTDPRTQMATLAEYYLLAKPKTTFLDMFGGSAPATSWSQHFSGAAAYDIGQPTGNWSVAAAGADPSNPSLTYCIYQRTFDNALVLYKPLSYGKGISGTTKDNTATTFSLGGTYRVLQADGTLGPPITSISLSNGEGAILVKTPTAGPTGLAGATNLDVSMTTPPTIGQPALITVRVLDAINRIIPIFRGAVQFTCTDAAALLPGTYTFVAADQGSRTFAVILKTAGPQTITVAATAMPYLTGSTVVTVAPGQPATGTGQAAPVAESVPGLTSSWEPVESSLASGESLDPVPAKGPRIRSLKVRPSAELQTLLTLIDRELMDTSASS
jgi:hypothetical protein